MPKFFCFLLRIPTIGRRPGEWSECHAQVNRFRDSSYKGFQSKSEAEASYLKFTLLDVERNKNGLKYYLIFLLSFLSRWVFSCIAKYCSFDPSWNMHVWIVLETCIFHDWCVAHYVDNCNMLNHNQCVCCYLCDVTLYEEIYKKLYKYKENNQDKTIKKMKISAAQVLRPVAARLAWTEN